jgi:hypothetical protein
MCEEKLTLNLVPEQEEWVLFHNFSNQFPASRGFRVPGAVAHSAQLAVCFVLSGHLAGTSPAVSTSSETASLGTSPPLHSSYIDHPVTLTDFISNAYLTPLH